jgi:Arc/MetJ family transcription regulator
MRTTITLDDDLITQAQKSTGIKEKPALIREALKALIERAAYQELAKLGGTEPQLRPIPRRRMKAA